VDSFYRVAYQLGMLVCSLKYPPLNYPRNVCYRQWSTITRTP